VIPFAQPGRTCQLGKEASSAAHVPVTIVEEIKGKVEREMR